MKVKIFYLFVVLALGSTIAMVVSGFEAHKQKTRADQMKSVSQNIENAAFKIAENRAKIKVQKTKYGKKEDVLTASTIETVSKQNGLILESVPPVTDIDHGEYIEKGYAVRLRNAPKMKVAKFMADLEEAIPGARIKSLSINSATNIGANRNVQFIIVKSFPKL